MPNNKTLEKFEQEYTSEISKLQSLRFAPMIVPEFKVPGYNFALFGDKFIYTKALSIAFAIPALAIVFGFFFYNNSQNTPYNQQLSQIEASNNRILNQINTLDNENNL